MTASETIKRAIGPPSMLFRYCSLSEARLEWVRSTLEHNEIYFARALEFNDPWDSRPNFRFKDRLEDLELYFHDLLQRHEPNLSGNDRQVRAKQHADRIRQDPANHLAEISRKLHNMLFNYGILSLSATCANILMWSHYADSHKGVCLCFSTETEERAFCFANRVKYQDDYPIVEFGGDSLKAFENTFLTKSTAWNYEQEWRLVERNRVGLQPFPQKALCGIILGARIEPPKRALILEVADRRAAGFKIFEARLNPENFRLDFFELA